MPKNTKAMKTGKIPMIPLPTMGDVKAIVLVISEYSAV
jgi:hypothetical protein